MVGGGGGGRLGGETLSKKRTKWLKKKLRERSVTEKERVIEARFEGTVLESEDEEPEETEVEERNGRRDVMISLILKYTEREIDGSWRR